MPRAWRSARRTAILATVTGARKGVLFDACARRSLRAHAARRARPAGAGQDAPRRGPRAARRPRLPRCAAPDDALRVSRPDGEQSNTSIIYGDRLIMKLFRRIEPGINPDFEIGRQLTEKVRFPRVPAVAGALEYERGSQPATLAMVQQLVESQGDGWTHATDEIGRFYDQVGSRTAPVVADAAPLHRACDDGDPDSASAKRWVPTSSSLDQARSAHRRNAPGARRRHDAIRRSRPSRSRATIVKALSSEAVGAGAARVPDARRPAAAGRGAAPATPTTPAAVGAVDVAEQAQRLVTARGRAARADQIGAAVRVRVLQDSRARRLPPRAGPVGRGGLLPARLRGGAGALPARSAGRSSRR